jgi:hypothetical protein
MTDSQSQTHHLYRLLDRDHQPLDQAEWPNDAEAVAWAEKHRSATTGPTFRRIERQEGDTWVYVSEAGESDQDRGPEDL